jgi:beta-barrel assembly-enhancing protease
MTLYRLCLILLFLIGGFSIRSQDKYQPIKCSGPIPSEFRTLIAAKVQRAMSEEDQIKRTTSAKKRVVDFISNSNRTLDELLTSGKVLFGDSISNYLESVASVLLKNEPERRKQLRFYAVKSDEVNAFATNAGAIFVTMGLMAKLENEGQLAYVLAHEITHFEKQHSIAMVLAVDDIISNSTNARYNNQEVAIGQLSSFSKDFELEADKAGFYRFIQAGYSKDCAKAVLDILLMSELNLEFEKFNPDFLAFDSLKVNDFYCIDSVEYKLSDFTSEDDSFRSHPKIETRRAALDTLLLDTTLAEGSLYVIGLNEFQKIKALANKEVIHLNILHQHYARAIFNAHVLLRKNPDNQYLEESIGKALYGMSLTKGYIELGFDVGSAKGQLKGCFLMFNLLTDAQINLMTIRYLMYLEHKYNSPFITKLLNSAIKCGIKRNGLSVKIIRDGIERYYTFKEENKLNINEGILGKDLSLDINAAPDSIDSALIYDTTKVFKYKKSSELLFGSDGQKYFVGNKDILDLAHHFQYLCFTTTNLEALGERIDSLKSVMEESTIQEEEFQAFLKKNKSRIDRKGLALGMEEVVFVDPFFYNFDLTDGVQIENSEYNLEQFKVQIGNCCNIAGLNYEILHPKSMSETEKDMYNNMALLNDWIGEKLGQMKIKEDMIALETEYIFPLKEYYGTPYFCFTGVSSGKCETTSNNDDFLAAAMYRAATRPRVFTTLNLLLFDIETGEPLWVVMKFFAGKAAKSKINSQLYDIIYQLKNSRTK